MRDRKKCNMYVNAVPVFYQMEHYKLDWHRFNLRQRLEGSSVVTAEEFERKTGTGRVMYAHMTLLTNCFMPSSLHKCHFCVIFLSAFLLTGDISSISGSDSDSEDGDLGDEAGPEETDSALDTDQSTCRLSTKAVFQNMQGQYLSLYRCVLQNKKVSKSIQHFSDLLVCA